MRIRETRAKKIDYVNCAFHKRLILILHLRDLTCKEVAHKLGVSTYAVHHWTCGRRWPDSAEKVVKLAEALGVTCDELLTGKGL